MEIDEFDDLALAWGADVNLWPAARQASARELIATRPMEAQGRLDSAALLDRALRASGFPAPSLALRARIIAAAPRPPDRFPTWRGWFGAALAASCAAGALAGLLAVSLGLFPGGGAASGDPAVDAVQLLHTSSDATVG